MSKKTLEEVCALIVDCKNRTPPEAPPGKGVAYAIGTPHIVDGRISLDLARPVTEETFATWTSRAVPKPDDIILTREAPVGRVARIEGNMRVCLGQRTMLLRPDNKKVHHRFLEFLLKSSEVQNLLRAQASGSTVPHLRVSQVRELELPSLPSIREQQAIAAALGALDDKITANERITRTSSELATSQFILHTADADKVPLSKISTPILGGTPDRKNPEYWGGEVPWASAKDVAGSTGGIILDTEEKITLAAAEKTRAKPVPEGSVILTARGTVGAVARVTRDTALNQSCYAFTPGETPRSVLYETVLVAAQESLNVSHGTVFSTLNMKSFEHLLVPAMDKPQASSIEEAIRPLHNSAESALREARVLAELRDTLLPQLMSGKLRVKDAERIVEDNV